MNIKQGSRVQLLDANEPYIMHVHLNLYDAILGSINLFLVGNAFLSLTYKTPLYLLFITKSDSVAFLCNNFCSISYA